MGNGSSKPAEKLKSIDREVNSLRSSIRSSRKALPRHTQDQYVQNLTKFSSDANSLRGKVKQRQLDEVQRNISNTVNEILTVAPREADLDMGAVETSSFIQMPINKREAPGKNSAEKSSKKVKTSQVDIARNYVSTLQNIDQKLKALRPQITVAIENKDTTQLRVHQQTIKVLATDLEMIEVHEHTPLGDKKKKLDNSITSQYQKISKAMKEIRRSKDITYLVEQKERAVKELDDIERKLEEVDSRLKQALQNNDPSVIKTIQDELMVINQRLSSVETIDESVKSLKMQLMDKIKWFYQHIDDSFKNSSQSDLIKAQANYEEIVKNIASGKGKDKDDIKVKLQSLQSFISNIEEDDDNSLKRKQQLLNNVKQSFSFILDDEQKQQNTNSANKKERNIFKDIDSLYNRWKSIQKDLKSTNYPTEDFGKIDKILEDIQNSIAQTRQQVTVKSPSPSNLNTKLNYSTPNLGSAQIVHAKFPSSLSVDQVESSIIKTRAKVYNLSTPAIQNINDQPVVLRNKKLYRDNFFELESNNGFSKVEEIKTQVYYIKEKFQESPQKQHLKNKLESYATILENYVHHKHQATANNARIVLAEVKEMLNKLSNIHDTLNIPTDNRRMSIEESFENIIGIQGAVEKLEKDIETFTGAKDSKECIQMKDGLFECRNCLENIKISQQYGMIHQQREEILKKINSLFHVLDNKFYRETQVENTKKNLNSLRDKVNRFSGAYKGVLYNKIEKDLNKLLVNVNENIGNKELSDEIVKDIEKHLNILEHRATKEQSFRRTISVTIPAADEKEKLIKMKNDLQEIKKAIDTTPANSTTLFIELRSRLDLVKLGLDQIKAMPENEERQKEVLYNEVETLRNVVDVKIALSNQTIDAPMWAIDQEKNKRYEEELVKIEEKFKTIKPDIDGFVGTTSDNKFYELDENSIRLVLKMDKLQFPKGTPLHNKKIELLKEIYAYGDLLDKRAKETEDVIEIEREIHDTEKNFERYFRLNDLPHLQQKLDTLRTRINNAEVNKNLVQRKEVCLKKCDAIAEKILSNTPVINEPGSDISKLEHQLSDIKKAVEEFNGIHADKTYYELDGAIASLFQKLDKLQLVQGSELYQKKLILMKDMHNYGEKLDNRAKETENEREINKQLSGINNKVDNYRGTKEELKVIESELKSVQLKMEKYKIRENDKKLIKQKYDILYEECMRFKKAKEVPAVGYIGSSSFIADIENLNKTKVQRGGRDDLRRQLMGVEEEFEGVKGKVAKFVSTDTSKEFKDLEEQLLMLTVKLNKLELPKDEDLNKAKRNLEKDIDDCLGTLDLRAQEVESLREVEKELEQISKIFDRPVSETHKNVLDEKLISLQVKLGKLHVSNDLNERKNVCSNRILTYLKQLKAKTTPNVNSADEQSGTFV